MKERGMIFNGEMVRALLDGRKTQTRRTVKPQPDEDGLAKVINGPWVDTSERNYRCPFGDIGDRIWVRETWNKYGGLLTYRADHDWIDDMRKETVCTAKWVPSIHMPRWASRILLEITDVRVERLNSISQEDAQAEGLELTGWRPTYSDPDSGGEVLTPYDNFAQLWESIYGEESWKANPWVWVIEFKRVEGGAA